jgi:flavin-dependent dehydrogenase
VLRARVVIAAHGAWERGPLPTQQLDNCPRGGRLDEYASTTRFDERAGGSALLGFKAHFRDARLPPDLMPLLAFPGGYGGLVNTGDGLLSMSCCVRRDALASLRKRWPNQRAGEALRLHIEAACAPVAEVLSRATLDEPWVAAGPLRTGIRSFGSGRIIAIGNAAAEAHPIVAEGISMAIQSAHLASAALIGHPAADLTHRELDAIRGAYESMWRRNFTTRIHAAALFAHLFMRPVTASIAVRALKLAPPLLTLGACLSGKDSALHAPSSNLLPQGPR